MILFLRHPSFPFAKRENWGIRPNIFLFTGEKNRLLESCSLSLFLVLFLPVKMYTIFLFSFAWEGCCCLVAKFFATPWTLTYEALSMEPGFIPGKNTWVGCHFLLQESSLGLLLNRKIIYHWATWEAHLEARAGFKYHPQFKKFIISLKYMCYIILYKLQVYNRVIHNF